jgi:hypothetical protein
LSKISQPRTTIKNAHKHTPGDGLHLINDSVSTLPDGTTQHGDVSDICIVSVAQYLCTAFGLPPIWSLWSECYPDDPMDQNSFETIKESAEPYLNPFDPLLPETRAAILADLRAISCGELAAKIEKHLQLAEQVEKAIGEKKTPSI